MRYAIAIQTVPAQPIAAVRRRARIGEIAGAWKPALDQVWAFLGSNPGLRAEGHNVFLYHRPARRGDPMDIDFGVQVIGPFPSLGEVISTETPAGEVATTLHVGPYDRLAAAHDAIHDWRAANNRELGGCSWEIYGDWSDDPDKLETRIMYLLR